MTPTKSMIIMLLIAMIDPPNMFSRPRRSGRERYPPWSLKTDSAVSCIGPASMIAKLKIPDRRIRMRVNCLVRVLMRCPLKINKAHKITQIAKNGIVPISQKMVKAPLLKRSIIGEFCAKK